jgi:membrane protease subunit HflC
MSTRQIIVLLLVVAAVFGLTNSLYTVRETERALLMQFGRIQSEDVQPGLHVKIPVAQQVRRFDGRVQTYDAPATRYLTAEKKPLNVDAFVKWRIADVGEFYRANNGEIRNAERRIADRVSEGLRNEISRRDMHEVVSGERDQLMLDLLNTLREDFRNELGVELVDVRVKRIELPTEVSSAVFDRMRSERQIEARELRAKGREQALVITADAERRRVVIEAEAYREAEQIRGDGDARSAEIYANAFGGDATSSEFYAFYRSLNAYREAFGKSGDLMVVDPDGEFFRYMKDQTGGGR